MRIELLMSLLAGVAGGLAGTLWSGLVSAPLLGRVRARRPQDLQPETATRILASAVLYGTCGAAAGFLFWLGWGLVALVAISWPAVGLLFGLLVWSSAALPALGAVWLRLRELRAIALVQVLEALVASLSVGLLCAFVWYRSG